MHVVPHSLTACSVSMVEGTVTALLEDNGRVMGVAYHHRGSEEIKVCFSKVLSSVTLFTPYVGLLSCLPPHVGLLSCLPLHICLLL